MSRDALVVGINHYQYLSPLKSPAIDAEAIAQRLENDGDFRKVVRLPETIATDANNLNQSQVAKTLTVSQRQLERALEELFLPESDQAPETALFYFSGHGLPDQSRLKDEKGYLAVSETNPQNPKTGISLRWLQCLLTKSPVRQQVIWLDCCHSGALIVNVGAANPGNSESRDRCFIASSRDFESSWSDLNSPYSLFTKVLLDGLDPNRLPGRWIDTFALADYVNQMLKGELQTPVCTNFGEAINITRFWQVQTEIATETKAATEICPYKGLEFFDYKGDDPKYFFGRERLVSTLLDQVRTSNFMALVGASGNGKSSVLRAGLLHQLRLGRRITGSESWQIRLTRPDKNPLQNLALAFVDEGLSDLDRAAELGKATGLLNEGAAGLKRLVQVSSAPRVILVIDQFEEVFTRCEDAAERQAYFACLMGALEFTADKLCLIIAMRADFVGKCLEDKYSGLAQRVQENMISVLPMALEELEAAICQPAAQVGLEVEPLLVSQMLGEIAGAPGSLPLLQYTLKELWQRRQGNQLKLETYLKLGGINGTLDKRATEIYESFDAAEQQTVKHIFLKLTQLGEGTEDTRRRVFQADLIAEPKYSKALVQQVIARLADAETRLLVTSQAVSKGHESKRVAIIDVAHEALIRHWQLLRGWLAESRESLLQQRKIETAAAEWREQKKKDYLLQGKRLREAKDFQKQKGEDFPLSDGAQLYIKKSKKQQLQSRITALGIFLLLPMIGTYFGLREYQMISHRNCLGQETCLGKVNAIEQLVSANKSLAKVNLSGADLSGANLFGANLFGADLSGADLSEAKLSGANLFGADLSGANLFGADLSGAKLSEASFRIAFLSGADLSGADLSGAYFYGVNLSEANFSGANLSGADLSGVNLSGVNLSGVNLSEANLSGAFLYRADLYGVNLERANLSGADLSEANLERADLKKADLKKADLKRAFLYGANLSEANFSLAFLHEANLERADLKRASLYGANFSGANFSGANFSEAYLFETDLSKTDLSEADLLGANFFRADFSEANLKKTRLVTHLTKEQQEQCAIYDPIIVEP